MRTRNYLASLLDKPYQQPAGEDETLLWNRRNPPYKLSLQQHTVFLAGLAALLFLTQGWLVELPLSFAPTKVSAASNTYYVAPNGRDENDGSITHPWRHIQKAANTLQPGDTVYIRTGTYAERVIPQNSGRADNYITYAAYPGETVTLDGATVSMPNGLAGLFEIVFKSYIKVSGLKVINTGPYLDNMGILVNNSSHIIIEKNYTYNTTSSGIGVWSSQNITVDGNEVVLACNDGRQENITITRTNGFEVKNNHVHNGGPGTRGGEGINAKDGSANGKIHHNHVHHLNRPGIYVDAWNKHTYNIEVYQNIVHDTQKSGFAVASEMGGLLENIKLYNNIAHSNRTTGISIARNGQVLVQPMRDIQIINNTVYHNGLGAWGGGISIGNQDAQGVIIRNNISSQNLSFQIATEKVNPPSLMVDYNLVYPFRNYPGEFHGNVESDPLFVNPAANNFHLQINSPAIDKGTTDGAPAHDYDDNPRPLDGDGNGTSLHDLGAFELTHLAATPTNRAVTPSGVATYTLIIGSGFNDAVNLMAASPSPSLTVQVNPSSVIPPAQATLTVIDHHPGPTLIPGEWHTVSVTATGGVVRTINVNLLVGGVRTYLPIVTK